MNIDIEKLTEARLIDRNDTFVDAAFARRLGYRLNSRLGRFGCFVAATAMLLAVSTAARAQDCGDPTRDGRVTSTDALVVLRAAIGLDTCELCLCDADGSGNIVAGDALAVLVRAVGSTVELACPACSPATTTTVPVGNVACGDPKAPAPVCDGFCGVTGQMCVESSPGSGDCVCILGGSCGAVAGPPTCIGGCRALWVCRDVGGLCRCVP